MEGEGCFVSLAELSSSSQLFMHYKFMMKLFVRVAPQSLLCQCFHHLTDKVEGFRQD